MKNKSTSEEVNSSRKEITHQILVIIHFVNTVTFESPRSREDLIDAEMEMMTNSLVHAGNITTMCLFRFIRPEIVYEEKAAEIEKLAYAINASLNGPNIQGPELIQERQDLLRRSMELFGLRVTEAKADEDGIGQISIESI